MKLHPAPRGHRLPALFLVCALMSTLVLSVASVATFATSKIDMLERRQEALDAEAQRLDAERAAARSELDRIEDELQELTARLDEVEAQVALATERVQAAARDVEALASQRSRLEARVDDRVRQLYKAGASDPLFLILTGTSTEDLARRSHYLSAVSEQDRETLEALASNATRLDRRERELEEDRAEVARLEEELEDTSAKLEQQMQKAAAAEKRSTARFEETVAERDELAAEERALRQQQAAAARAAREQQAAATRKAQRSTQPPAAAQNSTSSSSSRGSSASVPSSGGKACPQASPRSFTNTWGAARSGGRRHQGTDIMGVRGGNVYAITSGTIQFTKSGASAGLFLSLRGDDGNTYWYMHLQDFVAGAGQRVGAGQLIAHNGDTGNARGTTPHIHFELHPGGGGAVNPYPLLRSVCG